MHSLIEWPRVLHTQTKRQAARWHSVMSISDSDHPRARSPGRMANDKMFSFLSSPRLARQLTAGADASSLICFCADEGAVLIHDS